VVITKRPKEKEDELSDSEYVDLMQATVMPLCQQKGEWMVFSKMINLEMNKATL